MSEPVNIHHVEATADHDFDAATVERVPFAMVARVDDQVIVTALIDDRDRAYSLCDLLNKIENGQAVIIDLTALGEGMPTFDGSEDAGEDEELDELAQAAE